MKDVTAAVIIQDEKVLGTCHLATGRDNHLGGHITPAQFKRHQNATHDDILFAPHKTPNFDIKQTRMFRDGKKASLVEGSAGAELEERIPYDPERDIMFRKFVPSAFFGTNLAEILRERGVENVLVCGVKTNVCCRATATDASAYRFRTYMISDMLGTNTKEINDFHLAEMTKDFAKAISSDEVCERLKNGVF